MYRVDHTIHAAAGLRALGRHGLPQAMASQWLIAVWLSPCRL
ncbi:hypothetical protein [Rhodoferax sp. BAB1]|nr:hypothetical protein [Rhodoferax sp. BAB1]